MKNKYLKFFFSILIALIIFSITATPVFATDATSESTDYLNPKNIKASSSDALNSVKSIAGSILGIMQVVGVAVAIIMLIVLAIKYMSAAPNDKAEIKKHAVVYVIGAVVLFASAGILEIIKGFADTI